MDHVLNTPDRPVLALLRERGQMSVPELCAALEVTSTAVRQKLERLVAAGMVQRNEVRQGRGRPSFVYSMTTAGMRALGHNQGSLAKVLWQEFLEIEDEAVRRQVIAGVSRRLAGMDGSDSSRSAVSASGRPLGQAVATSGSVHEAHAELASLRQSLPLADQTANLVDATAEKAPAEREVREPEGLERGVPKRGVCEDSALPAPESVHVAARVREQLDRVARELRSRQMPVSVHELSPGLPVMRFTGCPYPDLSEQGHEICELETEMLSRMAGVPMRLAECRCHAADGACTFVPVVNLSSQEAAAKPQSAAVNSLGDCAGESSLA